MTTARLRELMDERVADVDAGDLAARAWARADAVRRRRRYAVIGTAAAVVLVVGGTAALVDQRESTEPSPSGRPTSSTSPAPGIPRATLAGSFRGAPFWWAPNADRDAELPVLQVPGLPATLSMADEEPVSSPPDHVDAVFATGQQRYRLLSGDRLVTVDLSDHLGSDQYDYTAVPGVSPDGTRIAFRQSGTVEIWNLPNDSWRTIQVPDRQEVRWFLYGDLWTGDGPPPERADPWTGPDDQYSQIVVGPAGEAELDTSVGRAVPGASDPGHYRNPELLAARQDGMKSVLGIGIDGRSKGCCSLIGWFSHDFVLFEASSGNGRRVLAWRVGTPDLYQVSQVTDVPRQYAFSSWAELAFTGSVSRSRNARSRPSRAWSRSRRVATTAAR